MAGLDPASMLQARTIQALLHQINMGEDLMAAATQQLALSVRQLLD